MKKLTFFILTIISFPVFAQIQIEKEPSNDAMPKVVLYDSLRNYLGLDYKKYIGQELYCLPTKYTGLLFDKFEYKPKPKRHSVPFNPIGKYFDIISIADTEIMGGGVNEVNQHGIEFPKKGAWFKLKEKDDGKIVFFQYDSNYASDWHFIVVGYYEKMNRLYSSKYIYVKKDSVIRHDKWLCKNIIIDTSDKWSSLGDVDIDMKFVLVKNDVKRSIYFSHKVFLDFEADKYINKFGLENWNKILDGTVELGWTEEMVKLSLGEPDKMNTGVYEKGYTGQWVYRWRDTTKYYYFENGKLSAIQDQQ